MIVYNKRHNATPPQAIYVGRPTKWGNPFTVAQYGQVGAVEAYKAWVIQPEQAALRQEMRRALRGRDLECWCAPKPCHANVIAFIASTEADPQ